MLSNDFACNIWQNVTYYKCIKNIGSEKGYIASHGELLRGGSLNLQRNLNRSEEHTSELQSP